MVSHRTTKLLYPDVKVFSDTDMDLRHAEITGTAFFFGKMTVGESVTVWMTRRSGISASRPVPDQRHHGTSVGLFQSGEDLPEVYDYKFDSEYDDHIVLFWNRTDKAKTISADLDEDTALAV